MGEEIKILIKDKETYIKVTKKMDKEGIKWRLNEEFASDWKHYGWILGHFPIYLLIDKYNRLTWTSLVSIIDEEHVIDEECNEITPEEYLKEDKTMTKADLKDWMIVETAEPSIYLVDKTHGYLIHDCGHMSLSDYTDDLKFPTSSSGLDYSIVRVYEPQKGLEYLLKHYLNDATDETFHKIKEELNLIWERDEESVEMTVAEIEEKLGIKNLKIVKDVQL